MQLPKPIKNPFVFFLLFLVVVSIRFNRNSALIDRPLNDAAFYMANVQHLRGDPLTYDFKEPFNERLLVCAFAAFLPFEPLTAINVANVLFLLVALYFLKRLLETLEVGQDLVWIGLYLFTVSFPTIYYATIGYTDPGVLCMIFMGAFAIISDSRWLFLLAMVLGTLAKEGIVMLIPVAVAYAYGRAAPRWYGAALAGLILFVGLTAVLKMTVAEAGVNTPFVWRARWSRAIWNLGRFNFWFSVFFSLGIPWALIGLFMIRMKKELLTQWKADLALITGSLISFLPCALMIFSAFPDGRQFWIASCFPISLVAVWWKRYGNPLQSADKSYTVDPGR